MTTITPWEKLWAEGILNGVSKTDALQVEITELRAFKERVEKQEPVAHVMVANGFVSVSIGSTGLHLLENLGNDAPLYTIPPSPVNAELVEALEQCAESLAFARDRLAMTGEGDGQGRLAYASDDIGSLAALVAARKALSTAQANPALTQDQFTYEQRKAIKEAHSISCTEGYFLARPQLDSSVARDTFESGFDRGWDAAIEIVKGRCDERTLASY